MPETAELPRLTAKCQRFVDEYLVDLNGTQAAIRAGYGERGAHNRATALLKLPEVQAAVEAGKRLRQERLQMTQDAALLELATIAYGKPLDDLKHADKRAALQTLIQHLTPAPPPPPTTQASLSINLAELANMTDEQLSTAMARIDTMVAGLSKPPAKP